jgi:hypothetical protein
VSGPKKPNAVFKVGEQAWAIIPQYGRGVSTQHVLVDVIDAKRTYVTVKAVNPALRLHPDKTDYHMQTGAVRNRDRYGSYAPRLMTVAEHEITERTNAARTYLEENGIFSHELRGFWAEQGPVKLADVLRQAEDDQYLKTRNEE